MNILSPNLTNWQTEWVTQCEVARVAIRNWGHIYKVGWNNQEYSDRPTLRYFTREELFPRLFKSFQWNECSNTMKMNFEVCSLNKTRSWTQQYDNWLLPGLVLGDGGDNTLPCLTDNRCTHQPQPISYPLLVLAAYQSPTRHTTCHHQMSSVQFNFLKTWKNLQTSQTQGLTNVVDQEIRLYRL